MTGALGPGVGWPPASKQGNGEHRRLFGLAQYHLVADVPASGKPLRNIAPSLSATSPRYRGLGGRRRVGVGAAPRPRPAENRPAISRRRSRWHRRDIAACRILCSRSAETASRYRATDRPLYAPSSGNRPDMAGRLVRTTGWLHRVRCRAPRCHVPAASRLDIDRPAAALITAQRWQKILERPGGRCCAPMLVWARVL